MNLVEEAQKKADELKYSEKKRQEDENEKVNMQASVQYEDFRRLVNDKYSIVESHRSWLAENKLLLTPCEEGFFQSCPGNYMEFEFGSVTGDNQIPVRKNYAMCWSVSVPKSEKKIEVRVGYDTKTRESLLWVWNTEYYSENREVKTFKEFQDAIFCCLVKIFSV